MSQKNKKKILKIENKKLKIENWQKILFPKERISKGDLINYYLKIADRLLPFCQDRPISMKRCPDGIDKECFYHKEVPEYFPKWIKRAWVKVKEEKNYQEEIIINNRATLTYLIGQGMITPHIWLSNKTDLNKPDRIIFDLDPPQPNSFKLVKEAALALKEKFDQLNLTSFVMTTGSKGLHIIVPIKPAAGFKKIRRFAKKISRQLTKKYPQKFTIEIPKKKRRGRLFLDYLRNSYGQTTVAPYSIRAIAKAPVAAPLDWDELDDAKLTSGKYNLKNIFKRLSQIEDPWKNFRENENQTNF